MRAKLLRQTTWLSPQFDGEGSQCVWDGDRMVAALFLKRFLVPMHAVPADGRGFIQALFVDPEYQGRGIGSALLQDGLAQIRRFWQGVIRIGGDPDRLFPGIPSDSAALTWFARRGAVLGKPGIDLQNLDLQETELPYGDEYRPATLDDRADLLAFLAMDFPGRWTWEVERHFETGGSPADIMLAEKEGRIVGFAMIYSAESARLGPGVYWTCGREGEPLPKGRLPGGLGPIGVGLSVRGKGMGLGLLQAGLAELQRRGVTEAVIDWTHLVQFYGKAGFRPWRYYTMAHFE
jgi:GNAT superfamily N-acetyltransferase